VAGVLRAPPGRAGRLWLHHRLDLARQGADLLEHKLRILRTERERMALRQQRTSTAWQSASREASTWLLRGLLVGGERSVRLASAQVLAEVEIVWEQPMGVRYPAEATCTVPGPAADAPPVGNAALVTARELHTRALQAAVRQAAVEAAVRVLEAEERATRRRLRAIADRWIPRLEEALAAVQLELEEEEHADGVRLRWAARRRAAPGSRTGATSEGERP
jgi:V/A-type H+/Na+-transporting ATPase subunit D